MIALNRAISYCYFLSPTSIATQNVVPIRNLTIIYWLLKEYAYGKSYTKKLNDENDY